MAAKKQSFEESMARLEEIVSRLERGETSLDESLLLFEEGMKLASACGKKLDQAEQAVVRLTKGADGAPEESPMEVEA
jgi:exodeoxyribonuclease VII small subunit